MPALHHRNRKVLFRGVAYRSVWDQPHHRVTGRPTTRETHFENILTLLSATDSADAGELAHCLELSVAYTRQLVDLLVCEGRAEARKLGRHVRFSLP